MIKIFGLLATTIFLVSCGKEIESSNNSLDVRFTDEVIVQNARLDLSFNQEGVIATTSSELAYEAWVRVPEAVYHKSGDVFTFTTRVYLDLPTATPQNKADEFFCEYSAFKQITGSDQPTPDGYNHAFIGCFMIPYDNAEPELLSYYPGDEIAHRAGHFLTIQYRSGSANVETVEVFSDIEIDKR
jgi:hypothetical protein